MKLFAQRGQRHRHRAMLQIIFRGHNQMCVGEIETIQLVQHMAERLQRI